MCWQSLRADPSIDRISGYLQVGSYFSDTDPRFLSRHVLLSSFQGKTKLFRTTIFKSW